MRQKRNKDFICIFAVTVLLLCNAKINAQKFDIGLRYNPEYTNLVNKNDNNAGSELEIINHFGYLSFGIGATYNFNNNIGLAVDLLFSREGQAFKGHFTGAPLAPGTYGSVVRTQMQLNNMAVIGDYEAIAELNYIKLPVMLLLSTDNTRSLYFTLLAGPQINFLYNVAQEVNGEDLEYPNTNITPDDLYRSITINGVIALGGSYNISEHLVFSARLRFDYGFGDVEKKDVMVSYSGAAPVRFYAPERLITHNLTTGLLLGIDYKL